MIENIRDVFWGILFIIVKVAKLRTLEFFHGIKDYSASSYVVSQQAGWILEVKGLAKCFFVIRP